MNKHSRNDDAFDERGLLRDGHKNRVPLTMRDAMSPLQREIAIQRARITDGNGNWDEFAFSRPGACSPMPPSMMPAKPHMRNIWMISRMRIGVARESRTSCRMLRRPQATVRCPSTISKPHIGSTAKKFHRHGRRRDKRLH